MGGSGRDDIVLLVVDELIAATVLGDRDPTTEGVLVVDQHFDEERQRDLVVAMGGGPSGIDPDGARYREICVVAAAARQPALIGFVAAAVWPVVERDWLWACEPPYSRARARPIAPPAARAALDERGKAT